MTDTVALQKAVFVPALCEGCDRPGVDALWPFCSDCLADARAAQLVAETQQRAPEYRRPERRGNRP